MILKMKRLLRNEAGEGGDVGAGGGDVSAAASGNVADKGGAAASVLAQAAGGETTPQAISEVIPEKYRVSKEDGSFDLEASARKLAEGQSNLEKRLGTGDVPPKTAAEYQIEGLPEGVSFDELKADPSMQELLQKGHEAGLTNKQMSFVVNEMIATVKGELALQADQVVATLRESWKTDAEYEANMKSAYKAAATLIPATELADFMNAGGPGDNPAVIKLLAAIGKEMREDKPVATVGDPGATDSIKTLMSSEAYRDPKHADHAAVRAQVRAHYEKTYGTAPVS